MGRLANRLDTTFAILPESTTPSNALSICGQNRLAVVTGQDRSPVGLMTRRDLQSAQNRGVSSLADREARLPPSVLAREKVELRELFSYNVLPAFALGARGVIFVSEQARPVGVLSLDELLHHLTDRVSSDPDAPLLLRAFTDYLFSRDPALDLDLLDGIVPLYWGARQTEILVRCLDCGYLNRLSFLDPKALPPCQSPDRPPHTLNLP